MKQTLLWKQTNRGANQITYISIYDCFIFLLILLINFTITAIVFLIDHLRLFLLAYPIRRVPLNAYT